ncbi:hypothetical protein AURDEDRAFT_98997 [Auricularia subglabra TFB-10046 SS5]|nr:hypothetical protein AURDEDRAFT_98997 [Auricularia subglabra TFB-10046 SS5]
MATLAAESSFHHQHTSFGPGRGGLATTATSTTTTTTVDPIPLRPGTVRPPTLCGQEIHMPEGAPEIKSPELRPWTGPFLNAHSRSRGSTDSVNTHGSSSRSNSARSNRPVTPTTTMQDELPTARGSVRAQVENMEAKARERERPTLHRTKSRSSTRTTFPGPQLSAAASQTPPEPRPNAPKPHRVPSFDAPPPASSRTHDEKPSERPSHARPGHPLRSTTVPPVTPPPPLSRSHTVPRPGRSAAFSDNEDGPARPRLFTEMEAGLRSPIAGLRSPRMGFVFSSLASASSPSPAGNTTASAREHPGRPSRSSAVHIGPQPQPGHTSSRTSTSHTNASKHDSTATVREAAPGDKGRCSPGDTSPAKDTPDPPPDSSQETGEHAQEEPEQQPKNEDAKEESVPGAPEQEAAAAEETEAPAGPGATTGDGVADASAPAPASSSPPEPSPSPGAPSENAPHNPAPQTKRAEFKVAVESDSDTEREGQQPPSSQTRRAPMSQPAQAYAPGSSSHRQPHPSEPAPAQASTPKGPTASTNANAPAGASSYLPHGLRHSASRNGESPPLRHSASRGGDRQSSNAQRKPSPPLSKSTTPPLSKPSPPPAMSAALRDMLTRRDKLREQMSDLALELERVQSSIHTEEERLRVEVERQRIERERQEHEQRKASEQREKRSSPPHERPARGKTPGPDRGYASEWEHWQHDPAAWERAQKKQEEERLRAEQLRQWAAQAKEKEERARREQQQQRAREEARRRADEEARRKVDEEAARRRAEDSARGQRLSKMVVHAWDEYNTFWTNLQRGGDAPLRMAAIRWPVIYIDPKFAASPELVLNLLTVHQIATFLLSPFHSQEKSHKERIRDALLRWHPDRFTGRFLNRVVESDKALVVQGLNVVTSILKSLLDRL